MAEQTSTSPDEPLFPVSDAQNTGEPDSDENSSSDSNSNEVAAQPVDQPALTPPEVPPVSAQPEPVPPPSPEVPSQPQPESFPPPVPLATPPPEKPERYRRRRRGSVFFPLLLIVLGGALLLNNLGIIAGTAWGTLLSLWPVIFIAWGLDVIWRGDGVTGAVFLLGLGTVFLLGNYGYLQFNPWQVLFTIWPALLVAIGYDILIGRRQSWWTTLLGVVLIAGLMAGTLWFAGVGLASGQAVAGEKISFGLQGATRAAVQIDPAAGSVALNSMENQELLLQGTVPPSTSNYRVIQEFTKTGDQAILKLQATGMEVFIPSNRQNQYVWNLALTTAVPVDLQMKLGAGEFKTDLTGLQVSNLVSSVGAGSTTITLPATGNFEAKIDGGIGSITIYVPQGMAVQLKANTALTSRSLPAGYVKQNDNTYVSPDYNESSNQVVIDLGLAIGQVTIVQK